MQNVPANAERNEKQKEQGFVKFGVKESKEESKMIQVEKGKRKQKIHYAN